MLDRFDQTELLELVEGELRADRAKALTRKLASDPLAVAYLEKLKQDRKQLRAVDHPQVPLDFFAQLEPLMARPMLMEPAASLPARPGSFRRMHRRNVRRARWRRFGLAAAIVLSLFAGVWAATQQLWPRDGETLLARNGDDAALITEAVDPAWPPSGSTVHHHVPTARTNASSLESRAASEGSSRSAADNAKLIVADFALVLIPQDRAAAESALENAVAAVHAETSLVRNFSFAEAQRLASEWRLANAPKAPSREVTASSDQHPNHDDGPHDIRALAQHVREHVSRLAAGRDGRDGELASAHLHGETTYVPSLEQQLDLSSRGGTYTIGVPAKDLVELVNQLNFVDGCHIALRMLPSATSPMGPMNSSPAPNAPRNLAPSVDPALELWVSEGGDARAAVQRAQSRPDTVVLIAVIVSESPAAR